MECGGTLRAAVSRSYCSGRLISFMALGTVYCGGKTTGTFRASGTCLMLRIRPRGGQTGSSTSAGDHDQTDAGFDIGVQVQRDVVFAGLTDGAVGQAHFALGSIGRASCRGSVETAVG